MSKRALDIQLYRLTQQIKKGENQINSLEVEFAKKIKIARDVVADLKEMEDCIAQAAEKYKEACERELKRAELRFQQELKSREEARALAPLSDEGDIKKASTLAFFDSLIFAIGNWSNDGQAAFDCELACQSILFPTVYENVMKGNEDYYVAEVPPIALEIVRRGREYIKHIRASCEAPLIDPAAWESFASVIQNWWVGDALPLIYGARDPVWEETTPLSLVEMVEWRDMPASRALHFPLIFDGMELVKQHGDDIRKFTGLPEFNKQQVLTRIDP